VPGTTARTPSPQGERQENANTPFFTAPDAYGDLTLWRGESDADRPTAVLRYTDLPHSARYLWPVFVAAVIA
jgi:hypothetical protein